MMFMRNTLAWRPGKYLICILLVCFHLGPSLPSASGRIDASPARLLPGESVTARPAALQASNCRTFVETGHTVCGVFLDYWGAHGGLVQQGYPISGQMQEKSDTNGKTYTVQYFERAIFEYHTENRQPHDVLLSLLGVFSYARTYPNGAPGQR